MEPHRSDQSGFEWPAGWTLAAPPEQLLRETASPLYASLSETPLTLSLTTPGLNATLAIQSDQAQACHVRAEGLRVRCSSDGQDLIVSLRMLDANTLGVAAGGPGLAFSCNGRLSQREQPPALIASHEPYHVVMMRAEFETSHRMAIVAGIGDVEMLIVKARGSLAQSAHDRLDQNNRASPDSTHPAATALDYIKSRLRPASQIIPFAWPAREDETPAWDLSLLWVLTRALIPREPECAGGLIGNVIDLITPEGELPSEGGKPIRNAPASFPVLAQLVLMYQQQTGGWPAEINPQTSALPNYLLCALNAAEKAASKGENITRMTGLLQQDTMAWLQIREMTGQPMNATARTIREKAQALATRTGGEASGIWELLDPRRSRNLRTESIGNMLEEFAGQLDASGDDPPCQAWVLADIIERHLVRHFPAVALSWRQTLARLSTRWPAEREALLHALPITHSPRAIVAAGLQLCWPRGDESTAQRGTPEPSRFWQRLDLHRRKLALAALVLVLGFSSLVIYLQFRPTLPGSVFQARAGMVLQHYHAGEYDEAMGKLMALERRQHIAAPRLLFIKGKIYFRKGAYPEALECFNAVREAQPTDPNAAFNLGLTYFRLHQYDQAETVFSQLAETFGRTHPAMAFRARKAAEYAAMMSR